MSVSIKESFLLHVIVVKSVMLAIIICTLTACIFIKDRQNTRPVGVHAAFYNSQGDKISISTIDGRIVLADSSLNILNQTRARAYFANSSFFSLNDKQIVFGGREKKIGVLDSETLKIESLYDFKFNSYTTVLGYHTLGGCGENGHAVFYDFKTQDTMFVDFEKEGAFHLFYIIPDTVLVISSGYSGYEFDISQRKNVQEYKGHRGLVYCIMPNHAQDKVVTASTDSLVRVFSRVSGGEDFRSPKLDGEVFVACYHPSDNTIAASTSNGTIYFFPPDLSEVKMKIKAFSGRINTIHYSPSGKNILAGSEEGGVKIFDTENGQLVYEMDYSQLE